ncbi:MAG: bluetail domain-containing putative surface protein, partial [Rhizomicrobium sp.]
DTLVFNGDFSGGLALHGSQMNSVETIRLAAGHSYNVTTDAAFHSVEFDGSQLGAGDSLVYDGTATVAGVDIWGGAGNDVITVGTSAFFDLSKGGNDTVNGGSGNDGFYMGATLTASDHLDGGGATNTLELNGNYSSGLVLGPDTLLNFDKLTLDSGFSYSITTNDGMVAAGHTLQVVDIGTSLTFDGSAETDGAFSITALGGVVNLVGGAGSDVFSVPVNGIASDSVDGGGGNDTLLLTSIGSSPLTTLGSNVMQGIETLELQQANVKSLDSDVAAGHTLNVVVGGDSSFDGSHETDGAFNVTVDDTGKFTGGAGDDTIHSLGRSSVKGGLGADTIINGSQIYYGSVEESTSTGHDFDTVGPGVLFHLWFAMTGVDASVTSGSLSEASFDSDLAAAVGAPQLGSNHAVVFSPTSGDLAGDHFLVVDANGTAGYQAGQDLVIELGPGATSFTTANFAH